MMSSGLPRYWRISSDSCLQNVRPRWEVRRPSITFSPGVRLNAINDALAGRVIHDPFPAHGVRDGAALSGMLALGLDGDRVLAEDVELAFRERLLVQLAALGRRCDGVEDAGIGNAGFGVVRN